MRVRGGALKYKMYKIGILHCRDAHTHKHTQIHTHIHKHTEMRVHAFAFNFITNNE